MLRGFKLFVTAGVVLLSLLGFYAATDRTIWMVSRLTSGGSDHPYLQYPLLAVSHFALAALFMGLGPFQFVTKIRVRYPRWHRWSGRLFIVSGLISVWASMILIFYLPRQVGETTAVVFFGTLLTISLLLALWHARHHQFGSHREWMIRAFAIGLGVVTTRLFLLVAQFTIGITGSHPDFWGWFDAMLWLGFSITLLIGEVWINLSRKPLADRSVRPSEKAVAYQSDF